MNYSENNVAKRSKRSKRQMKEITWLAGLVMFGCMFANNPALAEDATAPQMAYTPASTSVAILPVVNASGERDTKWRNRQTSKAQEALTKLFREHGFSLVDHSAIEKAIGDLKIDLSDEEQQKRATLYQIGKAVHANLVVFCVISATDHQEKTAIFRTYWQGKATVRLWLLDADKETPILSAEPYTGESSSGAYLGNSGNARVVQAIANAIGNVLKVFLKSYSAKRSDK